MANERVWDKFLTAQDKASLKERAHQVWGYGERPALVLIDLYRWVFGDRRQPLLEAMKDWPGSCGRDGVGRDPAPAAPARRGAGRENPHRARHRAAPRRLGRRRLVG